MSQSYGAWTSPRCSGPVRLDILHKKDERRVLNLLVTIRRASYYVLFNCLRSLNDWLGMGMRILPLYMI